LFSDEISRKFAPSVGVCFELVEFGNCHSWEKLDKLRVLDLCDVLLQTRSALNDIMFTANLFVLSIQIGNFDAFWEKYFTKIFGLAAFKALVLSVCCSLCHLYCRLS
jgi:hypothetical protein